MPETLEHLLITSSSPQKKFPPVISTFPRRKHEVSFHKLRLLFSLLAAPVHCLLLATPWFIEPCPGLAILNRISINFNFSGLLPSFFLGYLWPQILHVIHTIPQSVHNKMMGLQTKDTTVICCLQYRLDAYRFAFPIHWGRWQKTGMMMILSWFFLPPFILFPGLFITFSFNSTIHSKIHFSS